MKKVFMIMPFEDEHFEIYNTLKKRFENDFIFSHASDNENQQNILKDIVQPIYKADVVIANLTGLKANIMYELGIAHSMNKKTIIITEDINTLPFDLKNYRAVQYGTHFAEFANFVDELEKLLKAAIEGKLKFGNPVFDFLDLKKGTNLIEETEDKITEADSNKGYIDLVADAEEEANKFVSSMENMVKDIEKTTKELSDSSYEMEKKMSKGKSLSPSYIRAQAVKVAEIISAFAEKICDYNKQIRDHWDVINKNLVCLLESNVVKEQNSADEIVGFVSSLNGMREGIKSNKEPVEEIITVFSGDEYKAEKNLSKASIYLVRQLNNYLDNMEDIDFSIGKLIKKCDEIAPVKV